MQEPRNTNTFVSFQGQTELVQLAFSVVDQVGENKMLERQAESKLGKGPICHSKKFAFSALLQIILVSYKKAE